MCGHVDWLKVNGAPISSPYRLLLLAGIVVSLAIWIRLGRKESRLVSVYFGALLGAFTGAKLVYLAAEGWMFWDSPQRWLIWATGKTILGALLGGYAGVEIAKVFAGYTAPTGDLFALVAPVGIIFGRIGCFLHGCCLGQPVCQKAWWTLEDPQGTPRWPAVPAEIVFNLITLVIFLTIRRSERLRGQLFHVYLVAYGVFRFLHEMVRDTPRMFLGISGYQIAALACIGLGLWGFWHRRHFQHTAGT
jgi:phosphatidylglycerol:prolipoprotein diacylglycerol transferase